MTTALEIAEDALALILVDEANTSPEPDEIQLSIRFMNDMMTELEQEGVYLNYTPVTGPSDVITSPPSANGGIKHALAERLASVFGLPYAPSGAARKSAESLLINFMQPVLSSFPGTMPVGSGNRCLTSSRFSYPEPIVNSFLSRAAQTTTISAIDTPVVMGETWTVDRSFTFTTTTAGRSTYDGTLQYLAKIEANLTIAAASGDRFTFYIAKNGALLSPGVQVTADEVRNVFIQKAEPIVTDDFLEIYVENNTGTNDLVVNIGTFRVT